MLRLISGIIPPDSGSVKVNGSLIPLLSLGVGFSDELTAHDNVYQYGMILGFSKKEMDGLYDDIIQFSGLEKYQYMPLKNYSSGMRVRLGFAIAIQIKPNILVLDEVLSVGDLSFKEKSREKILELCNSGMTVVIVSHSMDTISELCNRAMFLKDGKIDSIGEPDDVIDSYLASMHDSLGPSELLFTQRRKMGKEDREKSREFVHLINKQATELELNRVIHDHYSGDIERSVFEYITWKNLITLSHFEAVSQAACGDYPGEDFIVGYPEVDFLKHLGDKPKSQEVAADVIKNLCKDGFICFGDGNLTSIFSKEQSDYLMPDRFTTLMICTASRTIPVIFETKNAVKINEQLILKILDKAHCAIDNNTTFVLSQELYAKDGIVSLLKNRIRFLGSIPLREIEEKSCHVDFSDQIISPENKLIFNERHIFAKKGRFIIDQDEIDGFGYFNPGLVSLDYKAYFRRLEMLLNVFEETNKSTPLKPDTFIREVAKGDARYFSGEKTDGVLDIQINPDTLQHRQRLFGSVFLYHSGDWNALECYRHYELGKLTEQCFNLYLQIIDSEDALHRGKNLLSLINTAVRTGAL